MGKKKLLKGAIQDALNGCAAPRVGGIFPLTGQQGVSAATVGQKLLGNLGPTNGVPGVSATLQGGEGAYVIEPGVASGLDPTRKAAEKAMRKKIKRAQKKARKPLIKAQRDPISALSRLELLAAKLPARHPARVQAAAVVLKSKMLAEATAATDGSLAKAAESINPYPVIEALSEVESALGISPSSMPWRPAQIDARGQLAAVMDGSSPRQSLSGTQNSGALTAYTSPAAVLGQVLKTDGLGEQLAKAEAEVRAAEASGNSIRLSAAHQDLTGLRLKAAHRAEGL